MLQEGKKEGAVQSLNQAQAVMGEDIDTSTLWEMGALYEEAGRSQEAVEAYMQIHYLSPDEARAVKALLRVAQIYEHRSELREFRKILEVIASLDAPESVYAQEKLMMLDSQEGSE